MLINGPPEFQKFAWSLQYMSPQGMAMKIAEHFEAELEAKLGRPSGTFDSKIQDALAETLLTRNEADDLLEIDKLRDKGFDAAKSEEINALKTWMAASQQNSAFEELLPTAKERLEYVAGNIAVRLSRRTPKSSGPFPEPDFSDAGSWLSITDR